MPARVRGIEDIGLERFGKADIDAIRFGTGARGIERAEVHLSASAFGAHRHDTYGIGITTEGVQVFGYRGSRRVCLAGQLHVLHPDELHDGGPGTDEGFGYRMLYIAPEHIRAALAHGSLPFVIEPVHDVTPVARRLTSFLTDIDEPIDELGATEVAVAAADVLLSLCGHSDERPAAIDTRAVQIVRDFLEAHACEPTPAADLERVSGIDRYTIARQFRRAYGTSPHRYRTQRRLARARTAIEQGMSLAQSAAEAGFADQSHMTRQFKRTYGFTPGRWLALTAAGARQETATPGRLRRSAP